MVKDQFNLDFTFYWQDVCLAEYPGVNDSWMDVVSSQGSSLLNVDLSSSDVTDTGLACLKNCRDLQELTLNCCDKFSEYGLKQISGKDSRFPFLLYSGSLQFFLNYVYNLHAHPSHLLFEVDHLM